MFDLVFHLSIFFYILALFSGLNAIRYLRKKISQYKNRFLQYLFAYYIVFNVLIFLYFIFQYAQTNISILLSLDKNYLAKSVYHIFYIPLSIGSIILFLSFGLELTFNSIKTTYLKRIQISVFAIALMFILLLYSFFKFPFSQINLLFDYIKNYSHIIISIAILISCIFNRNKNGVKDIFKIASSYLLVFSILSINSLIFFKQYISHSTYTLINPLAFVILNTVPLTYLKIYLLFSDFSLLSQEENRDSIMQKIGKKHSLTKRELEVLNLMSKTKTNDEIAEILFISVKTVKNHIHHIYKKTGVKSRIQIINMVLNFEIE